MTKKNEASKQEKEKPASDPKEMQKKTETLKARDVSFLIGNYKAKVSRMRYSER
jgi:hypothetical protein